MNKFLSIVLIILPLTGFSQKRLSYIRSNTKIEKIVLLAPATKISVISQGSKQQIDSVLTQETFRFTSSELQKSFPDSVETSLYAGDSTAKVRLADFVVKISKDLKYEYQIKKYKIPDSIMALFDTSKGNYIFCTYNAGFNRTRDNLVNTHITMEVADVLLGLGLRPLESAALISCFILDLKARNILYFQRDLWEGRDPTDNKVIKLQLIRVITHYFI